MHFFLKFAERGLVPDSLVRWHIRNTVRKHVVPTLRSGEPSVHKNISTSAESGDFDCSGSYEESVRFFELVLGSCLKYSCSSWDSETVNLDQAEEHTMQQYVERARIQNGHSVLDLGCGWGSFVLWAAPLYPNSSFVAVTNSPNQKNYIDRQMSSREFSNVRTVLSDVEAMRIHEKYDRIVAIELVEHVRDFAQLLDRVSGLLTRDGLLFVQMICHRTLPHSVSTDLELDWITPLLVGNGVISAISTLPDSAQNLTSIGSWEMAGTNYQQTASAWYQNLISRKDEILEVLERSGNKNANVEFYRWKIFCLAIQELMSSNSGEDWGIAQYLFGRSHPVVWR